MLFPEQNRAALPQVGDDRRIRRADAPAVNRRTPFRGQASGLDDVFRGEWDHSTPLPVGRCGETWTHAWIEGSSRPSRSRHACSAPSRALRDACNHCVNVSSAGACPRACADMPAAVAQLARRNVRRSIRGRWTLVATAWLLVASGCLHGRSAAHDVRGPYANRFSRSCRTRTPAEKTAFSHGVHGGHDLHSPRNAHVKCVRQPPLAAVGRAPCAPWRSAAPSVALLNRLVDALIQGPSGDRLHAFAVLLVCAAAACASKAA